MQKFLKIFFSFDFISLSFLVLSPCFLFVDQDFLSFYCLLVSIYFEIAALRETLSPKECN